MPSETALSISIVESKIKGVSTAIVRRSDGHEFFLHSRDNPLEEARIFIEGKPIKERTLYVVLGFGLGYHVRELLERIPPSSHIIVVEPDFACLSGRLLQEGGNNLLPGCIAAACTALSITILLWSLFIWRIVWPS